MPQKLGLRRIAAYAIDYVVIAIWIGLLALIATSTKFGISDYGILGSHSRWLAQGQAFLVLTLPIYLYFTLSEAFGRKATFGKRGLGLRVSGEPERVAVRNFLKFLPWEVAHFAIWHSMDVPFVTTPQLWGLSLFVLSICLSSLYIVMLFIGDGRTPYDRLSGSSVKLA